MKIKRIIAYVIDIVIVYFVSALILTLPVISYDTEKYLKLIEERNREIRRQKESGKPLEERERNIYANRQTEIKINQEYFEKMGISMGEEENHVEEPKEMPKADIKVDLDADYFQWKEGKKIEDREKASKAKGERFQRMLKGFTSGKK